MRIFSISYGFLRLRIYLCTKGQQHPLKQLRHKGDLIKFINSYQEIPDQKTAASRRILWLAAGIRPRPSGPTFNR